MQTENNSTQKNKISLVLYIGGSIVAIMGIALLINNIILYNQTIAEYVAQGYDSAEVVAQMPPTQLLPIVFQVIGLYGGVSMILFCMGMIFQKISSFMSQPMVNELTLEALESADSTIPTDDQDLPEILVSSTLTEQLDNEKLPLSN